MNAGISAIRIKVASASTANVRPSPNIRMKETSAAMSAANEIDMTTAAAVTTRPVRAIPRATLSSLRSRAEPPPAPDAPDVVQRAGREALAPGQPAEDKEIERQQAPAGRDVELDAPLEAGAVEQDRLPHDAAVPRHEVAIGVPDHGDGAALMMRNSNSEPSTRVALTGK